MNKIKMFVFSLRAFRRGSGLSAARFRSFLPNFWSDSERTTSWQTATFMPQRPTPLKYSKFITFVIIYSWAASNRWPNCDIFLEIASHAKNHAPAATKSFYFLIFLLSPLPLERTRRASLVLHSIYFENAPERTVPRTNGAKITFMFKLHLIRYFYIMIKHMNNSQD